MKKKLKEHPSNFKNNNISRIETLLIHDPLLPLDEKMKKFINVLISLKKIINKIVFQFIQLKLKLLKNFYSRCDTISFKYF